jgi:hypothetical protein
MHVSVFMNVLFCQALMIYSSIGSGFCSILLGIQIQLQWGPSWLTAVIMYIFCAVYSFGGGTVPFVLLAEVFLIEVCKMIVHPHIKQRHLRPGCAAAWSRPMANCADAQESVFL